MNLSIFHSFNVGKGHLRYPNLSYCVAYLQISCQYLRSYTTKLCTKVDSPGRFVILLFVKEGT